MRARRHPRAAAMTDRTWPMTGASTQAASSMSLRPRFSRARSASNGSPARDIRMLAKARVLAGLQAHIGKDGAGFHGYGGIDEDGMEGVAA